MKILIFLAHPAHFHLFKNVIYNLKYNGHTIKVLIKSKDLLEELVDEANMEYSNILVEGRSNSLLGMGWAMIKKDWRIFLHCINFKPSLLIGTPPELGHIGTILKIPYINVREDDATINRRLFNYINYPWANHILTPISCYNAQWENKSIKYHGYHELAYLHPNHFKPNKEIVKSYLTTDTPYFLLRFVKLTAHHDQGIKGISNSLALKIVNILSTRGRVLISSEREIDKDLEKYRISVKPSDIHHLLAYATLYIGDSQTMAAEAAVLGTPFIRFNDFAGRIGYLNELEYEYKLGYSFKTNESEKLLKKIIDLLSMPNLKRKFTDRKKIMLDEKIDVALFLTRFIENYPDLLLKK